MNSVLTQENPTHPRLAETILPAEIWDNILKFLTDSVDIFNAGKTCTFFEKCLHSKILVINFSETLPLLLKYIGRKNITINRADVYKDILNCRLVSKRWRDAVDNYFEKYFLGHLPHTENIISFPPPFSRSSCAFRIFKNKREYEQFTRKMRDHPRNPFIGRSVHFKLKGPFDDYGMDYFRTLLEFFQIFGKYIWTLHLEINDPDGTYKKRGCLFRFIMKDVFLLAPNLKVFLIKTSMPLSLTLNYNQIKALAPPPALESLEIGRLVPENVKRAILERHSDTELRTLYIHGVEIMLDMHWPNLKELHIMDLLDEEPLNGLQMLSVPQLEILGLKFRCHPLDLNRGSAGRALLTLMQKIVLSSSNLKTLGFYDNCLFAKGLYQVEAQLGFPQDLRCSANIKNLVIQEENYDSTRFRFPHTHLEPISDYSFLRWFPHVETISIIKSGNTKFTQQELEIMSASETVEVHKYMYSGRMYESNIWNVLPALQAFSFGKRIYTRSSYERH